MDRSTAFASRVYAAAGIIGLIEIVPLYLMEPLIASVAPPPVTHPEFYYGFAGVTLAWQVLFLMLSRDPLRYRPLMLPTVLEKAGFVAAVAVLLAQGRMSATMLGPVVVDAALGCLFVAAYLRTAPRPAAEVAPGR